MGDTSNWEFAATVAAVCIGMGGLLLLTITALIGVWRASQSASRAADGAAEAGRAVRDLARLMADSAPKPAPSVTPSMGAATEVDAARAAEELAELRGRTADLIAEQARLQDAVRNLVEAGVLRHEGASEQGREIEAAIRRLEEQLARLSAAVVNLGGRMP